MQNVCEGNVGDGGNQIRRVKKSKNSNDLLCMEHKIKKKQTKKRQKIWKIKKSPYLCQNCIKVF